MYIVREKEERKYTSYDYNGSCWEEEMYWMDTYTISTPTTATHPSYPHTYIHNNIYTYIQTYSRKGIRNFLEL